MFLNSVFVLRYDTINRRNVSNPKRNVRIFFRNGIKENSIQDTSTKMNNPPPSSSGSGHLSFKEAAGIRIPLGVGYYERKLIMDYQ